MCYTSTNSVACVVFSRYSFIVGFLRYLNSAVFTDMERFVKFKSLENHFSGAA